MPALPGLHRDTPHPSGGWRRRLARPQGARSQPEVTGDEWRARAFGASTVASGHARLRIDLGGPRLRSQGGLNSSMMLHTSRGTQETFRVTDFRSKRPCPVPCNTPRTTPDRPPETRPQRFQQVASARSQLIAPSSPEREGRHTTFVRSVFITRSRSIRTCPGVKLCSGQYDEYLVRGSPNRSLPVSLPCPSRNSPGEVQPAEFSNRSGTAVQS